jgi:hypothetical protein
VPLPIRTVREALDFGLQLLIHCPGCHDSRPLVLTAQQLERPVLRHGRLRLGANRWAAPLRGSNAVVVWEFSDQCADTLLFSGGAAARFRPRTRGRCAGHYGLCVAALRECWWCHSLIETRARLADGSLSPAIPLSEPGQKSDDPQVAVNALGDAAFAWRRSYDTHYRIQTRARSAAGTLGRLRTLTAAGRDAGEPQVAVGANDHAVVVWSLGDGTNSRIQAAWRRHVWRSGDDLVAP